MGELFFLIVVLFAIVLFLALFAYFIPIGLWISAYFAGVRVAIFKDLVGMRLRKVPPRQIITPKISATKAGLEIELDRMEAHFLAGGNVNAVTLALISADKANIDLTFERAASIDLAGRDVFEVRPGAHPVVVVTPVPGHDLGRLAQPEGARVQQVEARCAVEDRAVFVSLAAGTSFADLAVAGDVIGELVQLEPEGLLQAEDVRRVVSDQLGHERPSLGPAVRTVVGPAVADVEADRGERHAVRLRRSGAGCAGQQESEEGGGDRRAAGCHGYGCSDSTHGSTGASSGITQWAPGREPACQRFLTTK